jgi:F-type H+-transporting ATPase subunit gamma
MAKPKEIRRKISSIKKTGKITSAMQMVAASKMRKAQKRMQISMPYAQKISAVIDRIAQSSTEYRHPYLDIHNNTKRIGIIVISTDRGLCGALNTSLFKAVLTKIIAWQNQNINVDLCLIGSKAENFFKRLKVNIRGQISKLGDNPTANDIIGITKIMRDAYTNQEIDKLFLVHNEFVSTIAQKPKITQLLPVIKAIEKKSDRHWDYIYEPNSGKVLEKLLIGHLETQVYQAIVDNIACEQAARMMAMQNATDNSKKIIDDLQLVYNKARQAAITQEIAEIVAGAEAV